MGLIDSCQMCIAAQETVEYTSDKSVYFPINYTGIGYLVSLHISLSRYHICEGEHGELHPGYGVRLVIAHSCFHCEWQHGGR